MSLRETLEQLQKIVEDVRSAATADDKTPLRNLLALREQADLIDGGRSEYDVIVFGDLNRFKGLNDRHGHDAGDIAIRQAGEMLKLVAGKLDGRAFRQSGDEFVILIRQGQLPDFISETPTFANISFIYNNESLKSAMSFGYAVNDGKSNFDDLLKRAEVACQNAKDSGDGTCAGWSDEIQQNQLVNFRERCQRCGARVSCNVPKENAPEKLLSCPCCGEPF